jgi:hypothetical protein
MLSINRVSRNQKEMNKKKENEIKYKQNNRYSSISYLQRKIFVKKT